MAIPTDLSMPAGEARVVGHADELLAVVRGSLGTAAGTALLAHLQRRYLDRVLPPSASDAELRHLEGQRSVVVHLRHLVATARRAPSGDLE